MPVRPSGSIENIVVTFPPIQHYGADGRGNECASTGFEIFGFPKGAPRKGARRSGMPIRNSLIHKEW
jgi:hypothetical protein